MTNKERYSEWAAEQEYLPISMQPWWMDAVCAGKEWDVLFAEDEQHNILGVMPYLLRKRAWFRYILMPPMSQSGGIWVTPEVTGDRWKTAEVCRQLKEQLDGMGLAYYYQQYIPGSLCVEALHGLGFKTKERTTYRVEDLSDMETLVASFSKNKRRQLQKALSLQVSRKMDVETFWRFHSRCLELRKRHCSYTREFLLVLERKARRLKQCEIISICNSEGQPYAAAFLVWDNRYMYYLIPTYDPGFAESGASALLVLEAMKLAREKQVHFDFEGSMERGIANHYKQFGSKAVTYYAVEKYYKPLFRLAIWFQKLREWRFK
ncbi:MAG: GNAT family N-acetyltransferase [Paludibacteraceae bacterium]|jgi:hypothetical protein|nr:GNAT family N-acetyltransferase [Paludibacteraceae bacterium]